MKRDFQRPLALAFFILCLSACGQNRDLNTVFQSASDACTANEIAQQFIVHYFDGHTEVVRAPSKEEFINGFLKKNLSKVQYAEHDFYVHSSVTQLDDSTPPPTTDYADNWGVTQVHADALWKQNVRGSGVVVAVVDSGVDITHPQLKNQIYLNPGEEGTDANGRDKSTNGVDDDGNGFVDDVNGWDFVHHAPLKGDNAYHGTHVSGIIAASHNDTTAQGGPYVEGMAPGAKILPLAFLDSSGTGAMSDAVLAINYAVARGARVINASWGGPVCSQSLRDTIAGLAAKNIVFVNAAGNDSVNIDVSQEYPASLNLAAQITVGATGNHDYMAYFSNYGAKAVHIFAPGQDIVSTVPGGGMADLSGTSMATPFVSGALALLLSAEPTATIDQLRQALYSASVKNSTYVNASQGRLDMATALADLKQIVGN